MRALDLFAGPGGWSQACKALGIDELGIDNDPDVCATATAAGHKRACMDVRRWEDWSPVDGLIASPPCQTFSSAGVQTGMRDLERVRAAVPLVARGVEVDYAVGPNDYTPTWDVDDALFDLPAVLDRRTTLVLEPMRFVRKLHPTWVALEQVPGVLPIWRAYAAALDGLGYHTAVGLVHAECFGVPQTRTRAILIAHTDHRVQLPTPTHSRYHGNAWQLDDGVDRWVSMAEALGWGMTARPYVTVAAGTAAGGVDPQSLGGSGARATVAAEHAAGRWVYRGGNQPHSTERDMNTPAPTVHFGAQLNDVRWVMRGSGNVGDSADRPFDEPAPTMTSKGTAVVQSGGTYMRVSVADAGGCRASPPTTHGAAATQANINRSVTPSPRSWRWPCCGRWSHDRQAAGGAHASSRRASLRPRPPPPPHPTHRTQVLHWGGPRRHVGGGRHGVSPGRSTPRRRAHP
jgi:DNA (cytosine-5)-methyltransferase 1